jgi:hypothetical protein
MDRPYTVALQDGKVLPTPERIAAECRFISALESGLGGPEGVAATYRAWIDASESQLHVTDRRTAALAVRWPTAYHSAAKRALTGLSGLEHPTFEIRLAQPA